LSNLPVEEQEEDGAIERAPLVSGVNEADLAIIKSILESENILKWGQGEYRGLILYGVDSRAIIYVDKKRSRVLLGQTRLQDL
jgi:hypothetical protein